MRIVLLNLAFDASLREPSALLARYATLTGLGAALTAAGATVSVIQRFLSAAVVVHDDVRYVFVCDGGAPLPPPSWTSATVIDALRHEQPGVVHINGLMFPGIVREVRTALPHTPVVVQNHAGFEPPHALRQLRDRAWHALRLATAWSFTSADQADPWRAAGLVGAARVIEVVEASATFAPLPREAAVALSGVSGSPALLWVGRLNGNKDPLCVLRGFDHALDTLPDARLWMIYREAPLEANVRALLARRSRLKERVTLVGPVAHEALPRYYSAADLFVSGSHHEGSGYALIEAMSCGAVPVVTDIPPHRAIAGECGTRWSAGSDRSLAAAIAGVQVADLPRARAKVGARFVQHLSWEAIGRRTLDVYRSLR